MRNRRFVGASGLWRRSEVFRESIFSGAQGRLNDNRCAFCVLTIQDVHKVRIASTK